MPDLKITQLNTATAVTDEDLLVMVDDPSVTPETMKITVANFFAGRPRADGWIASSLTWTYVSATSFSVPGDYTTTFEPGVKIKLTQTSAKYFYVVSSAYSSPNTTVTVIAGSDDSIANATITSPYYSRDSNPQSFPGWFTYVPTWTCSTSNPSLGNGTLTSRFTIQGRKLFIMARLVMGTSTTYGSGEFRVSIPITAVNNVLASGIGWMNDAGVANYLCGVRLATNYVYFPIGGGTYITPTAPFTWGSGDSMSFSVEYEM